LAEYLNAISKAKEQTMSHVDVLKLHNIESVRDVCKHIASKGATRGYEVVMGHARLDKQAGETDAAAFSRIYEAPENIEPRRACSKSYPSIVSVTPISVETVSSKFEDDSAAAVKQLRQRAAKGAFFRVQRALMHSCPGQTPAAAQFFHVVPQWCPSVQLQKLALANTAGRPGGWRSLRRPAPFDGAVP
jgi:hypothetical protein